jgi:predicted RNase H-like nuclease (RuvC/YqgF family)
MARKARLTVFSRFLIMMLIVGPLAFFGASYYNGEDGVQNLKDLFNKGKEKIENTRTNRSEEADAGASAEAEHKTNYEVRKLKEELDYKQKRMDELYKENETLKRKLKQCESNNGTTSTSSSSGGSSSSNY